MSTRTMRDSTDGGEVVVVTGASSGVGRAVAHAFARRGARLGLLARGRQGLEDARREIDSVPSPPDGPGSAGAAQRHSAAWERQRPC